MKRWLGIGIGGVGTLVFASLWACSEDAAAPDTTQAGDAAATGDGATNPNTSDGATNVDAAPDSASPSGAVIEIIGPGERANAALAVGKGGHVVIGIGSTSIEELYVWKDGTSTKIPVPTDFPFSLETVGLAACATPNGHVAYTFNKSSTRGIAFFNGSAVANTQIPNFGSVELRDCTEGDRVLASPHVGGGSTPSYLWSPTSPAAPVTQSAGTVSYGVSADGTVAMVAGSSKDATYTAYPSGIDGSFFSGGINASHVIAGSVREGLKLVPVTYTVGATAVTKLPLPDPDGASPIDINDAGDVLLASGKKWWLKRAAAADAKTLDLSADYVVKDAFGIDAAGRVYLHATKKTGTAKVIGLVVTP